MLEGLVSGDSLFLACRRLSSRCVLTWNRKSSRLFFILEGYRSHYAGSTFMMLPKCNYLPRTPPPNTITLGFGASTYEFSGWWGHSGHSNTVYRYLSTLSVLSGYEWNITMSGIAGSFLNLLQSRRVFFT